MLIKKVRYFVSLSIVFSMGLSTHIYSQDNEISQNATNIMIEEVVVMATKKADAENVQDVPVALTAYNDKQIELLKVRDLQSLAYSSPNVALDDVGTTKGVANFSIRGLGINSSIPSIDPTVGIFVDGMYLGINAGVVMDLFDLESIEVLRGPQGILFGRNTTGGAVMINTKKPGNEKESKIKVSAESGFRGTGINYYAMGSFTTPLIEDVLSAKLAFYHNNDGGWHKNILPGSDIEDRVAQAGGLAADLLAAGLPVAKNTADGNENFGKSETTMFRPSLYWTPSDNLEVTVRYEHAEVEADGAVIQNHPAATNGLENPYFSVSRDSFDVSNDEVGFLDNEWDQLITEVRYDLGDAGVITSITGWRDFSSLGRSDIDGTPIYGFHADLDVWQEQFSQEIRLNRSLSDSVYLTLGLYFFEQDMTYNEDRVLLAGAIAVNGGGVQNQSTKALFGQVDYDINDTLTLNFGARYTYEDKDVVISSLINATECDPRIPGSCSEDFKDKESWKNLTPKLGFQWSKSDNVNVYGHWTKGVRSGGYNFRNGNQLIPPGPTNEEIVDAFELGYKAQLPDKKGTFNASLFVNDISDMQREVLVADENLGTSQVIRNTADARISGLEMESRIVLSDSLVMQASLGYLDGEYQKILFDISGDGVVNNEDKSLKLPRLAPWTWGLGFIHSTTLSNGRTLDSSINYSHRHSSAYTDNNTGYLNAVNAVDASMTLRRDNITMSLYGKNLLNEVNHGTDTNLPGSLGFGSVGTLMKGRVIGLELNIEF
jgi:iron complex outermembrane receptor protein